MLASDFHDEVRSLSHGKRLPTATYVYAPTSEWLSPRLRELVDRIRSSLAIGPDFNVVKFSKDFAISFLSYPDFLLLPHPVLVQSIRVQLATGKAKKICFATHANPPILHRKECFLPPGHPQKEQFSALTQQEEEAMLYEHPAIIGFKANWDKLVAEKGLGYRGHTLIAVTPSNSEGVNAHDKVVPGLTRDIYRHRTALSRTTLSKPLRQAIHFGVLKQAMSVFDYGCGLGTDVSHLKAMGFEAHAWDPAYFPTNPQVPADLVNIGYVLNVIEDPAERVEALVGAWTYARRVLLVSTLMRGDEKYNHVERHADGIVTRRNTFQKFFEPNEIHGLIETALDVEAIPLCLGVYVVFRDPCDAQSFLSHRSRRDIDWGNISRRLGAPIVRRRPAVEALYAAHKDLLDEFWSRTLELGRLPRAGEFAREQELREVAGSPRTVHRMFVDHYGVDAYEAACRQRKEDLLVYLALANFRKRIPLKHLDERLRIDLDTHFGSYADAQAAGLSLLLSLREAEALQKEATRLPFGWWDDREGHFTIHRSLFERLPPSLRVLVECGALLYGNPQEADLIKLHVRSHKLTFLFFDDFDTSPFPELRMRIKIDLPRVQVSVFEYERDARQQLLFYKERFVGEDHPKRTKMEQLSKRLALLGVDVKEFGPNDANAPTKDAFHSMRDRLGLGMDLQKKRRR